MSMTIESALSAHFKQVDGPSLPGASWLVRIEHGGSTHRARVKSLFTPDATRATRKDVDYQGRTTLDYLADEIASGWDPAQQREHTIQIGNPRGRHPTPAPWWRFW